MWWLIGAAIVAWGAYTVGFCIRSAINEPSTGGAAMIGTIIGIIEILFGLLVTGALLAWT